MMLLLIGQRCSDKSKNASCDLFAPREAQTRNVNELAVDQADGVEHELDPAPPDEAEIRDNASFLVPKPSPDRAEAWKRPSSTGSAAKLVHAAWKRPMRVWSGSGASS